MERKTPLELLEPSSHDDTYFISKHYGVLIGGTVGSIASCVANWALRRPTFSGVHRMIAATVGLAFAGNFLQEYRDKQLSLKDAIMRDYIRTHPELFEQPPRVKYADTFGNWIPMR